MARLNSISKNHFTREALTNPEKISELGRTEPISKKGGKINGLFSEAVPPKYTLPKGVRAEIAIA